MSSWFKWRGSAGQRVKFAACELCSKRPFTHYMVRRELWPKQHKQLCLKCFVGLLGRPLAVDDFHPCQFTNLVLLGYALAKGEQPDLTDF